MLPLRTAKKYLTSFSTAPGSLHCTARFFTPSTASLRVPSSLDTMGAATRRAHFTHPLLLSTAWPSSEAIDTVITDTLLSVDAVLELKQYLLTVHVQVTFSYSNLQDKVNCFTKTLQVRVQLLEWQAAVHFMYYSILVQVWGNSCTHYLLTQHWANLRVLLRKATKQQTLNTETKANKQQTLHCKMNTKGLISA